MEYTSAQLTREMRWAIAEKLADDRLDSINAKLEDVQVVDTFYSRYGKRILDIILAFAAVIVTLPINLVIGIITYLDVGSPLFFTQQRTGRNGVPFTIVKFRNMRNEYDENGDLLPANQRVTRWGLFVRKASLDELLNFWCVLKGDMSLIGPRPLPIEYEKRYNKRHRARLSVRPGLECPPWTPLDHARTWQDQLDNDVWYAENMSLKTDLIMCLRLVQYALDKKSTSMRANAGSGTFMGYDLDGKVITVDEIPREYIEWAVNTFRQEVIA